MNERAEKPCDPCGASRLFSTPVVVSRNGADGLRVSMGIPGANRHPTTPPKQLLVRDVLGQDYTSPPSGMHRASFMMAECGILAA